MCDEEAAEDCQAWSAESICDECEEATQAAQEDKDMHMQDEGVHAEGAEAETDDRSRQPSSVQGHPGVTSAVGVASAHHAATRDVARPLIDYRAMNERADRIAAAQQLRQALEAADLLIEQMNEEQGQEHRGGGSEQ